MKVLPKKLKKLISNFESIVEEIAVNSYSEFGDKDNNVLLTEYYKIKNELENYLLKKLNKEK